MPRCAPPVIASNTDARWITTDIIETAAFFQVTFRGTAFRLRYQNDLTDAGKKYPRTAFPSRAPADRLAKRLNQQFMTDQFEVREVK